MAVTIEARPNESASAFERWSPLGGLVFVVLFLVTFLGGFADDTGDTPQSVVDYARDQSGWIDFALIFALLSLILLGAFVSGLYARLRRIDAGTSSVLALVGGVAFTLLFFIAMMLWAGPVAELDTESGAVQTGQAEAYLAIEDVGWVVLGGAGVSAGLMMISASLAAMRAGWVRPWAGWLGVALGVVALATVAFFGIFAWLLWILLASVALLLPVSRTTRRLA